ncbi:uncharacterized protein A4U43_C06F1060 [Asparagus officinalis]|uniref:Uncharacterized protein n=1 Tax=Asparagus officinalis TaxID=4686 RepID=A0A5P1EIS3_ASPOF|nr:uncharacterized protein A4U43_C06F1060 [Asparagus officinalis]
MLPQTKQPSHILTQAMSNPGSSEEAQNPHWIGEHGEEWIDVNKDTIHVSAKALNIIWGNDKRFWQWIQLSKDESRYKLFPYNWMEIKGSLDLAKIPPSPSTTYEIFYVIKFKVDAMGWHSSPVTFELITPDGKSSKIAEMLEFYRCKGNEWHNVYGGEFRLDGSVNGKVKFSMSEVQSDWWKGGMILEGVIVRPKLLK